MNLNPASLKDLQSEMLSLLQIIDNVCENNDIEYWIESSTLIGAIRHKGCVPWSGNFSISVPGESYLRLISVLSKETIDREDVFLFYEGNDIPRNLHEKLATTKIITSNNGKFHASHVVISPARIIRKKDRQIDADIMAISEYFESGTTLTESTKVDKKYIKKNLKDALIEKNNFTQYMHFEYFPSCDDRCADSIIKTESLDYHVGFKAYVPYSDIFPLQKILFEGVELSSPNHPENYLSTIFGDYMTLPPKSQQTPKRSDEVFFCDSPEFAKKLTTKFLTEESQNFYHFSIRRFLGGMARKLGIFQKLKGYDIAMKKFKNSTIKRIKLTK
jgi:lipopolysaccharide cholinephosphotransferase